MSDQEIDRASAENGLDGLSNVMPPESMAPGDTEKKKKKKKKDKKDKKDKKHKVKGDLF